MRVLRLLVAATLIVCSSATAAAADEPSPPSPVEFVNSLPYQFRDVDIAIEAFQHVTAARGWSLASIAAWQPFARAVIGRESGGCPNMLRGAVPTGDGCTLARQGRYSDSGFGQVLMSVNGRWLCSQEGLCSKWDVVASPWNSMTAMVATIERGRSGPYCYTVKLRRTAMCRLAPRSIVFVAAS